MSACTFQAAFSKGHSRLIALVICVCSNWPSSFVFRWHLAKIYIKDSLEERRVLHGPFMWWHMWKWEGNMPLPGAHVKSQFPRSNLPIGNSLVHLKTGLAARPQWIALPLLPSLPVDCCCCHATATASLRSVRASLRFSTDAHTLQVLIHVLPWRTRPHSPYWSPLLQLSFLTHVVARSSDST